MTNLATERQISELQVAYLYCLSHLAHLGERSSLKLRNSFPTYESWVQASESEREEGAKRALGSDSKTVISLDFDSLIERAFVDFKKHQREGIQVLSVDSKEYPQLLKQIPDPPLVLFVKGSIDAVADNSNVAVVGTRDATLNGEKVASKIAKWLGEHRWCVVSGLAKGIDSAAHRGALDVRSRTVAVMATPLNKIYPAENKQLANDILDQGGCWISELPLWKKPHRGAFVQRDRIQSGISVAVVPVQTDVEGGTMHTVRYAEQQHRLVLCPRPIESEQSAKQYAGIRHLIESGRAIPFSSNEYERILKSLSTRRCELLNIPRLEQSNEAGDEPATTFAEVTVEQVSSHPGGGQAEAAAEETPRRKKRSRLQVGFDFMEEPIAGKPKRKSGKKDTGIQIRLLEQLRDEIYDAKRPDGGRVSDAGDMKLWLEEKIKALRKQA
jgi:DNA processing protein